MKAISYFINLLANIVVYLTTEKYSINSRVL